MRRRDGRQPLAADFEDFDITDNNNPVFGTSVITSNVWHHARGDVQRLPALPVPRRRARWVLSRDDAPHGSDSIQQPAIGTAWDAQTPTRVAAGRFAGQVDEARIWSVARTLAQIQSTMNTQITSPTADLLGRWAMNEGTGTTAANTAGSAGVNGTLQNGAAWTAGGSDRLAAAAGQQRVQLDGTDDHVDFGAGSAALGSNQFTLELWFKRTGDGRHRRRREAPPGPHQPSIPLISEGSLGEREGDHSMADVDFSWGSTRADRRAADRARTRSPPTSRTEAGAPGRRRTTGLGHAAVIR